MLKAKERDFKTCVISLENLVPHDNFYRQVEAKLDLSFVRDLVSECYSRRMGRPSIDPVVFFKLQLIMFFEGIRSERQLMEMVNLNLAYRWYTGYDLDEKIPDHSSLSKIRDRYGLDIFHRFFEKIVEKCIEAGLVWGKELYFDGTKVRANADIDGMVPRWYWEAKHHVAELFDQAASPEEAAQTQPKQPAATPSVQSRWIDKYDGTRITTRKSNWYSRTTDSKVSPTDPDASPMSRFTGDAAKLGYHTHYVVDGGKARIILAALVTPASIMDNTPMLDMARWVRFRWQLHPDMAVGDTKYGTVANIVGLEQDGIRAFTPTTDLTRRTKFYSVDNFHYDPQSDIYLCPQGQELPFRTHSYTIQASVYQGDTQICNACPVKSECTESQSGRHIHRSFFQEYLDRVQGYRGTESYLKAMRKRQVWVEPMFGEAKQWHQMQKFRLRGLIKVNIQGLLTAAGQNIKRLLKQKARKYTPDPANVMALPTPLSLFSI